MARTAFSDALLCACLAIISRSLLNSRELREVWGIIGHIEHNYMPHSISKCNTRVKNPAHRAGLLDCRGIQNFNFHLLASTLPTRQGLQQAVAVVTLYIEGILET